MRTLTPFLLVLAPALARADVRIVSPAGPFTQIQSAVDAAQDGDLLLVKSGNYASFVVSGKSLTIVGDTGNTVSVNGAARVRNLTSGQVVSIIRIGTQGNSSLGGTGPYGLYISNNLGAVRCESCGINGAPGGTYPHLDGYDGAYVQNCADVSFVHCSVSGGSGRDGYLPDVGTGGIALHAFGSTITLYDSDFFGGIGRNATNDGDGGNGASGGNANACTLFASHSSFHGGDGGDSNGLGGIPGYGAAGMVLVSGSLMRVLNSTMQGGHDGYGSSSVTYWPSRSGTTFVDLAGLSRTMNCSNPVRELTTLQLNLHGAANERVYLFASTEAALQWRAAWSGNLLVAAHAPHLMLIAGTTDASGNLAASITLDDLGPNVQSRMLFLQPLFEDASGQRRLGTPITLAELDQAF